MKKRYQLFSMIAICTLLMAGCTNSEQEQTATNDTATNVTPTITESLGASGDYEDNSNGNSKEELTEGQALGIVEEVTESEITIGVGQGGMAPEGGMAPAEGTTPELPGEDQMITSSQSYVIDSNTAIINEDGTEGTISDVQVGDFVIVEPNATKETAESITKVSPDTMGPQGGRMPNEGGFAGGQPGEMPEGGQPGEMPGGGQPGEMPGGGQFGQMPGQSAAPSEYTAVVEYTATTETTGETYESTGVDENAVHISGTEVTLNQPEIIRTSEDSTGGDNSSFYGVGAAALVTDGTLTINGGTITTNAAGGAGVFSYGTGVVTISDTTITTTKNTSGGIHVAGGGTLYASNLKVETNGESSAAIRSDRGGGTMSIDGGTYTSNGNGSPTIYCTADITVANAELSATGSEAICIEGKNSLSLTDCDLSGNIQENAQNDCNWNVILYQSMSGDSEIGNSSFSMTGGTLTAYNGGMFYTTNTESSFYLSNVDLVYSSSNDFLLKCTGNANKRGWGTSGANGADCIFTPDCQ